jgi:DNA-binding transcriptional regulator YiaG
MPNVAQVLKAEIQRLARKEVIAECAPLRKQVQALKQAARDQKELIGKLQKDLSQIRRAVPTRKLDVSNEEGARKARITPASIKSQRRRLKLSQRELAQLLRVSSNSVVRWEAGKSAPRAAQRAKLAQLRKLGRKDVKRLLEEK